MEDIFFHIDNLKHIFKENEGNLKELPNSDYNNNKPKLIPRPSILNINKQIKREDFSHKFYLAEDSSDSEDFFNEETKETFPSLMKVAKSIFDPYEIMITTDIKYFPRESNPGLIMSGIEDWVTEKHIKYFLQDVPTFVDQCKKNKYYEDNILDIYNIKIFVEQQKRYAYIQLNRFSQMRAIGEFFLNPIKKDFPSLNSKKEKIEIYYAYNILDLTKNHWYGVIFRNLPPNCDDKSLYNFTEERVENGIKYCLNPIEIDKIYCALIVCKELEYAEKLCNDLNNMQFKSKTFKVHLHPYTCKIRNKESCNIYETFSKDGYEFDKIADESEKCLEYSKNFMEFFFSNYINSFKCNRRKKEEETVNKNNEKSKNSNDNKNNNKNEKGKAKKKDLILATSIMDLIKKHPISEISNKVNGKKVNNENKNLSQKKETEILNIENKISNNINKNKSEEQKNEKKENNENKIVDNYANKNNIKKESNEIIIKDSNNIEIPKEPGEMDDLNIDPKSKYSENEINYYTYNMGDKNYYDEKEKEEQRKNYNKYKKKRYYSNYNKNNNFNKNNNYKHYNNHNNYNNSNNNNYSYKKKNNSPYHHPYSSSNQKSFSKNNYRDKDRDYNSDNYNKQRERSREKSNEQGIINKNKDKDKYNNDHDRRRDNSNNRYPEDRRRDNSNNRYPEDRNRKYNDNKFYDKKINYYDKEKNSRHSQSKERNRNDRKEKYNYSYKKYNSNKFK